LAHNHSDAVFTFAIFSQQNSRNLCFQESGLFRDFLHAFLVLKQAAYRKNNDPDRQQNFFYYKLQIRRLKLKGMFLRMSDTQGRKCGGVWGGWFTPPEKRSSRSQTTCSRSQNNAFVYMQCFAKQIKYFRNSRWTQTIELEICTNGSNSSEVI
jgi:hypothetical protein